MHAPQLRVPDARTGARHALRRRRPRVEPGLGHRYELLEIIGRSSTSTVFCALDLGDDRLVAIKTIAASQQGRSDAGTDRVRREAQTLARLRHPNLVRCLRAGVVDRDAARRWPLDLREGAPYIVLEHAAAGSLQRLVGALEWSDVRIIMGQLLGALGRVHRAGLLHRDVKPSNILLADLSPYRIQLADLDLVTPWRNGAVSLRADAAAISGTPAYMAPEQLLGRRATWGPWTDLYASGCVAWALSTGTPPYGVDPARAREGHLAGILPRYTRLVPPGALEWITRLLARLPADRFLSAELALVALTELDCAADQGGSSGFDSRGSVSSGDTGTELVTTESSLRATPETSGSAGDTTATISTDDADRPPLFDLGVPTSRHRTRAARRSMCSSSSTPRTACKTSRTVWWRASRLHHRDPGPARRARLLRRHRLQWRMPGGVPPTSHGRRRPHVIAPCRCLACQSPISHHHDMPARRTIGRSSLLWAALCSFALMLSFAFACRIEDDNQFAQEEEIAARFARAICESGRSCSCEVSVNCEEGVQSIVDGQRLSAVAAGLNYSSQCVEQQIAQLDESFCGVDTSEAPPCAVWYGDGKPGDPCEWISDNEFHAWLPAWTCRQGSSCIGGVCSPDLPGELHEACSWMGCGEGLYCAEVWDEYQYECRRRSDVECAVDAVTDEAFGCGTESFCYSGECRSRAQEGEECWRDSGCQEGLKCMLSDDPDVMVCKPGLEIGDACSNRGFFGDPCLGSVCAFAECRRDCGLGGP